MCVCVNTCLHIYVVDAVVNVGRLRKSKWNQMGRLVWLVWNSTFPPSIHRSTPLVQLRNVSMPGGRGVIAFIPDRSVLD